MNVYVLMEWNSAMTYDVLCGVASSEEKARALGFKSKDEGDDKWFSVFEVDAEPQ